jgi:rod shape-determining protein MreC
LGLCVLGGVLGQVQNRARSAGRSDFLTASVHTVVSGPAGALDRGAQGVGDFWTGMRLAPRLSAENRRLRAIAYAASLYSAKERVWARDQSGLRGLIGLEPIPGAKRIAASLIGYFPHENRATLSAGKSSGVIVGLPVVNHRGLLGVVQTVEREQCQIVLITSPVQQVGAMVLRDPPVAGILRGQSVDRLTMEFVSTSVALEPGDKVVTSGFSRRIPRGIPIGQVVQVENVVAFGTRQVTVRPSAGIVDGLEVVILR